MSSAASFLVRLTDDEREALRAQAEREHRSMQEVARLAIVERAMAGIRAERVRAHIAASREQHKDAFDVLAQ